MRKGKNDPTSFHQKFINSTHSGGPDTLICADQIF